MKLQDYENYFTDSYDSIFENAVSKEHKLKEMDYYISSQGLVLFYKKRIPKNETQYFNPVVNLPGIIMN